MFLAKHYSSTTVVPVRLVRKYNVEQIETCVIAVSEEIHFTLKKNGCSFFYELYSLKRTTFLLKRTYAFRKNYPSRTYMRTLLYIERISLTGNVSFVPYLREKIMAFFNCSSIIKRK